MPSISGRILDDGIRTSSRTLSTLIFISRMVMAATIDRPPLEQIAGGPATDAASITPPHSVNGKKDAADGAPSELSDLELDSKTTGAQEAPSVEDEDEEIEPDHYYGGGKIPVFKPVCRFTAQEPRFVLLLANTALCRQ